LTHETYECTQCGKSYTRNQIEDKLAHFKRSVSSGG
jgi:DNA-directed RNA polymerase subunit RPC12/RpoP